MKKLFLACIFLISINGLLAQSATEPAVSNASTNPGVLGDVGSSFTITFTLANNGVDDISGADAANSISIVINFSKSVPNFEPPNTALDALSGTAVNLFDFTYDAANKRYTAQQKPNVLIEAFNSYDLVISAKVTELSANSTDNSVGADLTITPPASSTTNDPGNDVGTAFATTSSTLPVKLASFTATGTCTVQLIWKTVMEERFAYFAVEHSINGKDFQVVQTVAGKNSLTGSSYMFAVNNADGGGYYRLKMVDTDGKYEYSNVLPVRSRSCNTASITIAPNPVTNNAIVIKGLYTPSVIRLLNMNGGTLQTVQSSGQVHKMNIGNVAPGIYFIQVLQNNRIVKTTKLLKK